MAFHSNAWAAVRSVGRAPPFLFESALRHRVGLLLGPLLGTLLLFATSASFDFINLVSAVVDVLALPLVAITTTYLYFDLLVTASHDSEGVASETVLPAEI